MSTRHDNESKALLEILEWKEEAYQDVRHLDLKKAVKKRISNSIEACSKLGFATASLVHK